MTFSVYPDKKSDPMPGQRAAQAGYAALNALVLALVWLMDRQFGVESYLDRIDPMVYLAASWTPCMRVAVLSARTNGEEQSMDNIISDAFYFAVDHKWWLIACVPILLALIVVRLLNPR